MDDIRRERLQIAHLWADLFSKVIGGMALVVAAWWTYANFTVERTHDPTMEVSVVPSVHPLPGDGDRDVGLEISIVEIKPLSAVGEATESGPAGSDPEVPWFDWTSGDGDPRPILVKRNLLASNEDFRYGRYQLNPGVRYREPFACIIDRNKLYAIRARFWTEKGSVADLVYIDTFSGGDALRPVPPS